MTSSALRLVTLAPPLVLLGGAALLDARTRRIPNWLNGALAITGIARAAWVSGPAGALEALVAAVAALLVMYIPFATGLVGGGDVKLLAAASAWLGLAGVPRLILLSAVCGGALSLIYYFRAPGSVRREVRERMRDLAIARPGPPTAPRVPYGISVAATAVALLAIGA